MTVKDQALPFPMSKTGSATSAKRGGKIQLKPPKKGKKGRK